MINKILLDILACPKDKGPLYYFAGGATGSVATDASEPTQEGFFYNPRLRLVYCIRDGIPIMLAEEAHLMDETQHESLMKQIKANQIPPTFE